jgi:hypothetical protein
MTTALNSILAYKRTYYITTKVIDQLKDEDDTNIVDQRDLMNEIDQAVAAAIAEGKVEHVWDKDEPARIVCLDSWFEEAPVFVLLKQDRTNLKGWAAITTVSKAHIEQNRESGQNWIWSDTPHPEHFANKLVKRHKGISIRANTELPNKYASPSMAIIYYQTIDNNERYERVPVGLLASRTSQIISDKIYLINSLEIYSQVKDNLVEKMEFHGF